MAGSVSLPETVIHPLPQIVTAFARPWGRVEISNKNDRFFALSSQIPIGTVVVLKPRDTSRSARLKQTQAGGARLGNPYFC